MKSVLAELYMGNYAPQDEHSYCSDSEYGRVFASLVELEEEILKGMAENSRGLFEMFNRESAELAVITGKLAFEDGVRLGIRLMTEALTDWARE